jgi:hypothetical protein
MTRETKKYDDLTHLRPVIMDGLVTRLPIIEQTVAGSEANLEEHQLFRGGDKHRRVLGQPLWKFESRGVLAFCCSLRNRAQCNAVYL